MFPAFWSEQIDKFKSFVERFTLTEYLQHFLSFIKGLKAFPIVIFFLVILSLGISIIYHKSDSNTKNIIALTSQFGGALSLAYLFSKNIQGIDDYPISRALLGQIGVSVGLIPFIFGIHADVFGDHDRQEGGEYNWFNLADIIKFPIEQLTYNDSLKTTTIKLASFQPDTAHLHLIVLDNTVSGRESKDLSKELKEKIDTLKKRLKSHFQKSSRFTDIPISDSSTLGQLIFLTILNSFYPINSSNSKTKVKIIIYNGSDGIYPIVYTDNIKNPNYMYGVLQKLKQRSNTKTSYASIFSRIDSVISTPNTPLINLTLIGDFWDETEKLTERNEFTGFHEALDSFPCSKVRFIQRFVLSPNGKDKFKKSDPEKRIELTESIIDYYFKGITIRDERIESFNLPALSDKAKANPTDLINYYTADTKIDSKTDDYFRISMYRPYTKLAKKNLSFASLKFDMLDNKADTLVLRLASDDSGMNSNTHCNIISNNNKTKLFLNQPRRFKIEDIDGLELPFYEADLHAKLRLEFYQPGKTQKIAYRLDSKERLSPTSATVLLFLYNMLYGASLLFVYVYAFQNRRNKRLILWNLLSALCATAIFCISTSQEGLLLETHLFSSLCKISVLNPSDVDNFLVLLGKFLGLLGIFTPFFVNFLLLINPNNTQLKGYSTLFPTKFESLVIGFMYLVFLFLPMFFYWWALVRN